MMDCTALVSWPSAPLTRRLVLNGLHQLQQGLEVVEALGEKQYGHLIQWSTYDDIDHELTNLHRDASVLASSYTFRKALIRKHYLAYSIRSYLAKNPSSILKTAAPQTYDLDLAFADELDEKWADDLYELSNALDNKPQKWWILKPGMADRGMGIRLFNTKEALQRIFEDFELSDSESEDGTHSDDNSREPRTAIVTSQLRHFVIQEYIMSPLLLDPREMPLDGESHPLPDHLKGHKFHLRAYCVASGALQLYLYDRILALFSPVPYSIPGENVPEGEEELYPSDLKAHLTNTSLQTARGEQGVRLFDELVGGRILEGSDATTRIFSERDKQIIVQQIIRVLAETYKAALQMPVHFQPLENAFELYGIDFLVEYLPLEESPFQVKILEINAEPAIELTGPRLTWVLEDLFLSIARVCVDPFLKGRSVWEVYGEWEIGQVKEHLIKCLEEEVRRPLTRP